MVTFERKDLYFLAFVLSVFLLVNPGKPTTDDYLRIVAAATVLNHGELGLNPQYLPETGYVYYHSSNGELFTLWGIISKMVHLPAALVGKICRETLPFLKRIENELGKPLLIERFVSSMITFPAFMLINVILFWKILETYLEVRDRRTIHFLLILVFFGTQLFRYSSGFEEGLMILLFLAAFIIYEECQEIHTKGLYLGLLAGLVLNVRVVGFPVFLFFIACQGVRKKAVLPFLIYFGLGLFPYALLFTLYNYVRFDSLSPSGFFEMMANYGFSSPNLIRPSVSDIVSTFFARLTGIEGLLMYSPILIMAPLGVVSLIKNQMAKPKIRLFIFSGVISFYYLAFHAALTWGTLDWGSWGPRYLTTAVPFAFLLGVPGILRVMHRQNGLTVNRFGRLGFVILVGVSFFIQILSVIGWDETEMYQGHSGSHIVQRAQNIWHVSFDGNPLAPHQNLKRPLFSEQNGLIHEETNMDGELVSVDFEAKRLYEGFSLWPVTLGYALKWNTWHVSFLMLMNLVVVAFFGFRWVQSLRV